jgi:hypothetical protein
VTAIPKKKMPAVFLYDNVHPHAATCTGALLKHFNWELFDRPPNNPDLAVSNYHPFTYPKN